MRKRKSQRFRIEDIDGQKHKKGRTRIVEFLTVDLPPRVLKNKNIKMSDSDSDIDNLSDLEAANTNLKEESDENGEEEEDVSENEAEEQEDPTEKQVTWKDLVCRRSLFSFQKFHFNLFLSNYFRV